MFIKKIYQKGLILENGSRFGVAATSPPVDLGPMRDVRCTWLLPVAMTATPASVHMEHRTYAGSFVPSVQFSFLFPFFSFLTCYTRLLLTLQFGKPHMMKI